MRGNEGQLDACTAGKAAPARQAYRQARRACAHTKRGAVDSLSADPEALQKAWEGAFGDRSRGSAARERLGRESPTHNMSTTDTVRRLPEAHARRVAVVRGLRVRGTLTGRWATCDVWERCTGM